MKFEEVLPLLRAGKKASNSDNPGCVYYIDERGRIMFENEAGDWRSNSETPLWKVANYDWTVVETEPDAAARARAEASKVESSLYNPRMPLLRRLDPLKMYTEEDGFVSDFQEQQAVLSDLLGLSGSPMSVLFDGNYLRTHLQRIPEQRTVTRWAIKARDGAWWTGTGYTGGKHARALYATKTDATMSANGGALVPVRFRVRRKTQP